MNYIFFKLRKNHIFCFVLQVLKHEDVYTNKLTLRLSVPEGWGCFLFTMDSTVPITLYLAHIGAQYIVDEPVNYRVFSFHVKCNNYFLLYI